VQFEQALAAEPARMQANWSPAWFYVDRGCYHRQLKRRQIHVVLYDEFTRRPAETLQGIFRFLEVDANFAADLSQKHNVFEEGSVPANMALYDFVVRPNWFSTTARAVLPTKLLIHLRPIVKKVITKKSSGLEISPLTDQTRQSLQRVFREDILLLQDLIQKDLSEWL
jgi:hypothetical protein